MGTFALSCCSHAGVHIDGLEAEMRQKRCNLMMTSLLGCDCVLDHRRGQAHFADFGADQS